MCGPSHGWITEDQPIDLGQQNSRGADQAYIDTQHDSFVGFGAGTLADMTLMQLLLVQVRKNENILMEVKDNLRQTQNQIGDISKIVTEQAVIIRHLMQQVKDLEKKTNDLENRSRRKNLVFYGVDDKTSESWDESEAIIKNICKTNLGMELESVERAHRLGRYNEKKRPIIVKFSLYKERQAVLLNAKRFKNSQYSVSEDYSPETRSVRNKLWEYAKTKREDKTNKAKLNFDKLIINVRAFRWDEEKEEVVPVRRQ
ncbi:hypothetical protein HPB50_026405 [Hyalomma asiaticum]|uniref:Uncharacterized protein n=1 Tax=Hyalomma asiaticum TaxID=266040 RepID=A0ACB7T4B8_HYAAI|nr:hypothetical protein HPB50_026405 [Hyalomma asiaticum]